MKLAAQRPPDASTIQLCLCSPGSLGLQATVAASSCGWASSVERKVDLEAVMVEFRLPSRPSSGRARPGPDFAPLSLTGDTDIPRDAQRRAEA